ncbi:hypothetical protein [Micromonospora sp. HM5-17]|jgi:hypothetical protein|uniref:hypothetical protein n=1 Tax=Micromonospora sp. HM5-17 TaxID=2487710 RepID=UPI000F48F334|nr:hypothetical protein [Micromonospora sp. HM5-17]ROT31497.1 hypothetical protein EF879_13735 [Micromonospora sp. HM5-17]
MTEVLEDGDIYFLYRPRVADERVESLTEVQRLLVVLRPWRGRRQLRLLVVGRKRLPDVEEHDRFWAFVAAVARRPQQLHEALEPREYATRTRGARRQEAARPVAEGAYVLARHTDHTHLAYQLELPRRPGPPQHDLQIEPEASHIVTVKNPRAPSPPGVGLREADRARLPAELQQRFGDRRFAPLDPPAFLDQPGVELVLIGAAHDASTELDVDLDAEVERAARDTVFEELRIGRAERPTEPLFAGQWR